MNWDDVIDRLTDGGCKPAEEIYMEHYGKLLAAQRPEFHGRYFRCTYGVILCGGVRLEVFVFPSEAHLQEFLEVIGDDGRYLPVQNVVLHLPEGDLAGIGNI